MHSTRHNGSARRAVVVTVVSTVIAVLLVVVVVVVATRLLPISRLEGEVSELIRVPTAGAPDVRVTLSGVDGTPNNERDDDPAAHRHADSMTIRAERTPRPQLGAVTVEAEAHDVTLPAATDPAAAGGPTSAGATAHAGRLEVTVEISDFVLTRVTGLHVTRLASAEDTSLVGGREDTARLTLAGSWPDGTGPSGEVFLDLSAGDRGGLLTPRAPTLGFPRIRLDADVLPLGIPVESLVVESGTIRASGTASDIGFPLAALGGEAP